MSTEKENTKKKSKRKSKKKEIKSCEIDFNLKKKKKHVLYAKEQCSLRAGIIRQFPEHHTSVDVFFAVVNLDGLVKLFVNESNLYAHQNGREFVSDKKEMRAFLGINYIKSINKLLTIKSYYGSLVPRALEISWLARDLETF